MNQSRSGKRAGKGGEQAGNSHSEQSLGKGWQTRRAAARILLRVEQGDGLEAALEKIAQYRALQGTDRAWARSMVSAVLRGCGRLDAALSGLVDRPLEQLDAPVRALLRVGAAQIWLLQIPSHAAVAASVDAAQAMPEARFAKGLINAVLRRATREPDRFKAQKDTSVWPDWITLIMRDALGEDRADALARYQLQAPSLDLQIRSGPEDPEAPEGWAEKLGGQPIPGGVRLPFGQPVATLPGYAQGAWWVQDAAAALAVRLLEPLAGRRVLDLCAAPGGKTLQLAAAGAHVTALDIAPDRLNRLQHNLARTGLKAACVQTDARLYRPDTPFDAVLLDAPCSALGILRRHPEAVWQRRPQQLQTYPRLQHELIEAAASLLGSGGVLLYCVCTPVPAEGAELVEQALASGLWRRRPVSPQEAGAFAYALTPDGDVLSAPPADWPDLTATTLLGDVFYMARLQKISDSFGPVSRV